MHDDIRSTVSSAVIYKNKIVLFSILKGNYFGPLQLLIKSPLFKKVKLCAKFKSNCGVLQKLSNFLL